jgi:glycosyltransferase involved in cell wall biosynthesis
MRQIKQSKAKIILTTHSPEPSFIELFENYYSPFMQRNGKKIKRNFEKCNQEAFYLADYIVFPCREAEEPYYKTWPSYKKIHDDNESKFVYLLTGSIRKKANIPAITIRKNLSLENEFVVLFVGRHNYVKGYDTLIEIGGKVLEKTSDITFVSCGTENDPILTPTFEKWKEIGYTSEVGSYINMADIFVLPNKETYFDLVLLEALSLGKIIVASRTGGNKFFSKSEGVFLFDTPEEATMIILKIKKMSKEERNRLEKSNMDLYNSQFTSEKFSKRYQRFYHDVIAGCVKKEYL